MELVRTFVTRLGMTSSDCPGGTENMGGRFWKPGVETQVSTPGTAPRVPLRPGRTRDQRARNTRLPPDGSRMFSRLDSPLLFALDFVGVDNGRNQSWKALLDF
jgi:hypothetical protein